MACGKRQKHQKRQEWGLMFLTILMFFGAHFREGFPTLCYLDTAIIPIGLPRPRNPVPRRKASRARCMPAVADRDPRRLGLVHT